MLKAVEIVLAVFLVVGIYGGVPALMLWGWARWLGRTQPRTVPVILSLIGFTLATASGLLAVSSVVWAHSIGGFPYYDPRLLRMYRWGALLSLSGLVFGIAGASRPGLLRCAPWELPCSGSCQPWVNSLDPDHKSEYLPVTPQGVQQMRFGTDEGQGYSGSQPSPERIFL